MRALLAALSAATLAIAVAPAASPAAQLFAPDSFWNARLDSRAPLDPSSGALVGELRRQVGAVAAARRGPWIGIRQASTPIYVVPADQPLVRVALDSQTPFGPRQAFEEVPLPPAAKPAAGVDAHLTVWQPATDRMWEFFMTSKQSDGWHARWGGAIDRVSRSPGYYDSSSWPGSRWYWGSTATSLPVAGGVIRAEELRRGRIDHALAMNIPEVRARFYSWPAQRTDGQIESAGAIPEGARFRLDPSLDLDALRLPRVTRMLAEAAQRYGIVVRDKSSTVAFYAEDPVGMPFDPYPALLGPKYPGNVNQLLAKFPWERLQLLRMKLCVEAKPLGPCPGARGTQGRRAGRR